MLSPGAGPLSGQSGGMVQDQSPLFHAAVVDLRANFEAALRTLTLLEAIDVVDGGNRRADRLHDGALHLDTLHELQVIADELLATLDAALNGLGWPDARAT